MNWIILITAGLFEVVWATALKMSNGFRNPIADTVCVIGMALSVWLLAVAMKTIPMGTACICNRRRKENEISSRLLLVELIGDAGNVLPPRAFSGSSIKSAVPALEAFVDERIAAK